ncbi:MAG: hypothetical protein AAGH92_06825 [Planctomycetota bacterium]
MAKSTDTADPPVPPNRATGFTPPGRKGYLLALVLLVVGGGAFVSTLMPATQEVREAVDGLQRIEVSASAALEVRFDAAGQVRLYDEQVSVIDGRTIVAEGRFASAAPTLMSSTGEVIEPQPIRFSEESERTSVLYRVGPYAGESLASYEVPAAGRYALRFEDDMPAGPRVLAFGRVPVELFKTGFAGVYGGAVALGLCFSAAVMIALITWARRNPPSHLRARFQTQAGAAGQTA